MSNPLRRTQTFKEEMGVFQGAIVCGGVPLSAAGKSHIVKWLFSPTDPLIRRPFGRGNLRRLSSGPE